jgi:hypothetical protein
MNETWYYNALVRFSPRSSSLSVNKFSPEYDAFIISGTVYFGYQYIYFNYECLTVESS